MDTFKDSRGNTGCLVCPAKSSTGNSAAASYCVCENGYYRALNENNSTACTGELLQQTLVNGYSCQCAYYFFSVIHC